MPVPTVLMAIAEAGHPVAFLRNVPARPTVLPVAPKFSDWRSEQRSWPETVALPDQSHPRTDLLLTGPDAVRLRGVTGVNSFAGFAVDNGKQLVAVNHEGYPTGEYQGGWRCASSNRHDA